MKNNVQAEKLLEAWVTLSGIIKNSRVTKGLQYNEAIVMNVIYNRYTQDGQGIVSIKEITVFPSSNLSPSEIRISGSKYLLTFSASRLPIMVFAPARWASEPEPSA